jgi:hypothetical protein
MNYKNKAMAAAAFSSVVLFGCGGGSDGGSNQAPAPVTSAQGVYQGTVSNGREHNTLILENDQFYTMYGNTVGGTFYASGFIQGNGRSNNGSFVATDTKDFYASGAVVSGSLSASYNPKVSFNGSMTSGSTTVTFTGAPFQNTLYNYDAGANLANIVGNWSVTSLQGDPVSLNVSASGSFSALSRGCSFTGTLKPRASGKNVFDAEVLFGSSPCRTPGQRANGIALEYPITGGKRQLIIAGVTADRTNGTAFIGNR